MAENNDKKAVTLSQLERVTEALISKHDADLSEMQNGITQNENRLDTIDSLIEQMTDKIEELENINPSLSDDWEQQLITKMTLNGSISGFDGSFTSTTNRIRIEDKYTGDIILTFAEPDTYVASINMYKADGKFVSQTDYQERIELTIPEDEYCLFVLKRIDNSAISLNEVQNCLIYKRLVEQFVIPSSFIEVGHLSESVIELLNKDCSISEEDYNSFVSFDVNELVFNIVKKPLYTVTYNATENCLAHFTVVCDMSKIVNYKTAYLNMKISNWSGPSMQQQSGGGVFSSNVTDLDGSYAHICTYQGTPAIIGNIVDGEGTLAGSIVPVMGAEALTKPYAKLAFVFSNLKVGQPISFDINDISLTIDGQPVEILNFGGFFPKEGCTVVSHIEEPDEPGELEEHVIAKYAFNSATDSNLLPTFGGIANYTIKDETIKNIFDSEWSPGVLNSTGEEIGASPDYPNSVRSSYFKVEPNTLYYFNKEIHVYWFNSNKEFISCKIWSNNNAEYQALSPEGAAYARVYRGSVADLIISTQTMNTINRTIMSSDDFTSCKFQNKAALLSVEYLNVTNKATVLNHLFSTCSNLTSVNASGWDTSNVTAMNDMFCQCSNLVSIEGLDTWDTGNVTNMQGMFSKCSKIQTLDLSSFDTKNLTNINYLFENCFLLKDLNVSTWDVSKISEFTWTFYGCLLLTELDLSGWNMKDAISTAMTFQNCQSLIKVICKQHTLLKFQSVIPARNSNSWGTIICEDLDSNYDISILQGKYWNIEGLSVEPDEPEVPDEPEQPDESTALYHVEYTPTEKLNSNDAAHFTVVMNMSDYIIGSTIHFNMNISNWNGPERTAMEVGGGIFVANSSALDGSFNGGSATEHLILSGNLINGNGVLEQTFTAPNVNQTNSFVKLAFSFTKVEMGQTISFDITNMSLTVNDNPVEILNFGGFFTKEGCTVTSYIDEPEYTVVKYIFNTSTIASSTDEDLMPVFNSGYTGYTVEDEVNEQPENIFNEWSSGSIAPANGQEIDPTTSSAVRSDYFEVEPETMYYFNSPIHWVWYDSNKNFISSNVWSDGAPQLYKKSPENARYARVYKGSTVDLKISTRPINTITRTIKHKELPTRISFGSDDGVASDRLVEVLDINTSAMTDGNRIFKNCKHVLNINTSNLDTSNMTNIAGMFCECQSLTSLDVSGFNTSKVIDMTGVFLACRSLTSLDVSSFDTSKCIAFCYMFQHVSKVTSIDISNFNSSNAWNLDAMFDSNTALTHVNLSNYDASKVTRTSLLFNNTPNLISVDLRNCTASTVNFFLEYFNNRNDKESGTILVTSTEGIAIDYANSKNWNIVVPSSALYNVEYTPTSERQVINFAVVMNRNDYVVGSTIDLSMDIDNWTGQDKTNMTIGGGIYTTDTTVLNGAFNEVSDVTTLLLDGTLNDGKGTLSATFNAASIPSGSYVILSFSLTTIDLGNTVTFDINDISLKVNDNPVEILNFGGFFPGEGCTVVKVN